MTNPGSDDKKLDWRAFFNVRTPFFQPESRRWVVTGIAGAWALIELVTGSPGWALIFGAAAGYLYYSFFVTWEDTDEEDAP